MVIGDLDMEGPVNRIRPLEAYPPLLVDANTELPFAISAQRLKTIARQPQQIVPANRRFQNVQAAFGLVLESLKTP